MRKKTIFRSSRLVGLVWLSILAAGPVSAQEPDTLQLANAPDVHIVQRGETLWALAERYLGDPFLWPEIYRLNTLVVEDPHWIYPGEELRLAAPREEMVALVPVDTAQAPVDTLEAEPQFVEREQVDRGPPAVGTTSLFAPQGTTRAGLSLARMDEDTYRAVRRHEFYNAGFLTENERMPWGDVLGATGTRATDRVARASTAALHERIEIRAPSGAEYRVGDSLVVAYFSREITDWGMVVVPTGIVRVESASGRRAVARVLSQNSVIIGGQRVLPVEDFRDPGPVRPQPVSNGVEGEIIASRDRNPVPGQQDHLFINVGATDGVVPGDVFEILRPVSTSAEYRNAPIERVGVVRIVHTRPNSSTGVIMQIFDSGIRPGARAKLVRKMPG